MKIEVFNEHDELAIQVTIRSDVYFQNTTMEESDASYLINLINRFCAHPGSNFRVAINSDTLPDDPNTPEGRKKWLDKVK